MSLIQVGEKEPLFDEIKSWLSEAGITLQRGFLTRDTVGKYCPIYLDEPFTSKELAKAEYLRIIDVLPEVGTYSKPSEELNPPIENLAQNEIVVLIRREELKKKSEVTAIEMSRQKSFIWLSHAAVASSRSANLSLVINPVRWVYFDEVQNKRWLLDQPRAGGWLGADQVMPKCLTPFKWLHGPNVGELAPADLTDVYPERTWDGEGRMEPILKFRRSEVAKLGEFDVAHTLEKSRKSPAAGCYLPELIVSQRFRQWVSKNHYKIRFAPVELVDE